MGKTLKAHIKLKRDNLFNYADSFIPLDGEICLVDTPTSGLRVKCGDGETEFNKLDFIDSLLIVGYFFEGSFYQDTAHETESEKNENRIYVDLSTAYIYIYSDDNFLQIGGTDVPVASATVSGTVKLYDNIGINTDGTITQKAITSELGKKIEVAVEEDAETVIFNNSNILE